MSNVWLWWKADIEGVCKAAMLGPMIRRIQIRFCVLGVLLSGCAAPKERTRHEASCAISLDYLKRVEATVERPIAVFTRQRLSPSRQEIQGFLKLNPRWRGHPDIAQALAEAKVREVSVVDTCPQVLAWLSANRILHNDARIRALTSSQVWPFMVLTISMPVITKVGDGATFYAAQSSSLSSGGTTAVRYRRSTRGGWQFETENTVSIS